MSVVYFDQQTGALHAVYLSKSSFAITKGNEDSAQTRKKKIHKKRKKGLLALRCYYFIKSLSEKSV